MQTNKMKVYKKIILEFTPEEIRLLAYGVIPNDLKKRLTEIAYHLDDEERAIADSKEKEHERKSLQQKKKRPGERKYNCQLCNKPINHKGNCLRCNLRVKRERDNFISHLLKKILNIESVEHKKIQIEIKNILSKAGYYVELEKKVKAERNGRIDLFAVKNDFSLGIEIDVASPRLRSIDKLNTLRPNLAIFILKSRNVNTKKNKSRLGLIKVKSLVIHLSGKRVQSLR